MNPNPQIAIIGGGLAGLTATIHLCKAGKSVVLFEKTPIRNTKSVANSYRMKFFLILKN
ncbi:FAD-binding protein [Flavobacterium piscinae]|uniref:FAD-dependent oxidoreductase n=1 Tax=Flavobacterium piscinae TaxID=2506424 RepID=UPI0019AF199C|nr:FAD-dependent oxidoreductase [Flavobacterium piscinae]MBC8882516.1 FAD-binding protein [Flavobacterium piscinae]